MWFTNKILKINVCFLRSRKLPCQNIVKECDDNNYTNSIVMKLMITNTSARPMCKASTLICCRFIWYPPPPHTKKLTTPLMSPWQKIVSPLSSLPPPPHPCSNVMSVPLSHCPDQPIYGWIPMKDSQFWCASVTTDRFRYEGPRYWSRYGSSYRLSPL